MNRVGRVAAGAIASLLMLILSVPLAAACDCEPIPVPQRFDKADVVARVVIEESKIVEPDADGGEAVSYTLRPIQVWKGDVVSTFTLTSKLSVEGCGVDASRAGEEKIVFATKSDDGYSASWCNGIEESAESFVAEVVEFAGVGEAVDPVPGDEPGSWITPAITAVVAMLLLGGVIFYWWILPRSRR